MKDKMDAYNIKSNEVAQQCRDASEKELLILYIKCRYGNSWQEDFSDVYSYNLHNRYGWSRDSLDYFYSNPIEYLKQCGGIN